MRSPRCVRPDAWRWLCWLGLWVIATAAQAHSSSNAYLSFSQRDGAPVLRTDLHLRDVDRVLDLDANRDGQVSWGEVAARSRDIEAWLAQGLVVRSAEAACALEPIDTQASERADGVYLSSEWRLRCPPGVDPAGDGLRLRYGLMFDQDNLHRGLLRIDLPDAQSSAILSPDRPEAPLRVVQAPVGTVLLNYIVEGVWHIWIGIDHILFLLSLLVLAPLLPSRQRLTHWAARARARPVVFDVLGVVTAFTVAHSITLGLSVLQWVQPPASFIEPVIAISVVLAALNNLLGWWSVRRWRLAFVFGLVHGFGFANVLLDLGLPAHALAVALGGFNLGVELGQLAIVGVFLPLAWWLRRTRFYRWIVVAGGSLSIAIVGALWTVQRIAAG
ncbi:HupE/UreJ family protein [Hydrogenophaga sp. OTU3427]|uniref:HupE/UreJ family protein n=1 Tax=Hydrogenophaga sp. OTU3427 TaxID=3043856 RepID=UPI00313CB98C